MSSAGVKVDVTLSMVPAGSDDVPRTLDSALTETSPLWVTSTAWNALWYISGTMASPGNVALSMNNESVNRAGYLSRS